VRSAKPRTRSGRACPTTAPPLLHRPISPPMLGTTASPERVRLVTTAEDSLEDPLVASISACFPCYNDAPTIEAMVRTVAEKLEQLVDDFEVVVVDDGSAADSVEVLTRLQQELSCVP